MEVDGAHVQEAHVGDVGMQLAERRLCPRALQRQFAVRVVAEKNGVSHVVAKISVETVLESRVRGRATDFGELPDDFETTFYRQSADHDQHARFA